MRLTATVLAIGLGALPFAAQAQQITGAGSTFAAPIYAKWGDASSGTTGVKLNYQAIGSGAGINQINNRTVDFGASDMPVAADQLAAHKLMQFPTVIGGVDIIVNIPGVKPNELKLTGPILADIYLGKITKWNDKEIVALNPGLKLPSLAVAPVHRADGSGTTFVFTDYLGMQSPEWKSKVGSSTSVSWPVGAGAKGSDGVAGTVHQIPGGIGYDESAYAAQNHLTTSLLKNKAGRIRRPDHGGVSGRGGERGLVESGEFRGRPERPAGRRKLADRVGDLRAAADRSEGCRPECRGEEILRLGLRSWQRHRHPIALHPAADQRSRRDPGGVAEGSAGHHVTAADRPAYI